MPQLGVNAFEKLYSGMEDARAQLRVGTQVIDRALTSGRLAQRGLTDHGSYDGWTITLRLLASDEDPHNKIEIGRSIDVEHPIGSGWNQGRVTGRKDAAGLISLQLHTLYEPQ